MLTPQIAKAQYTKTGIEEYDGNPLVEAIFRDWEFKDFSDELKSLRNPSKEDREGTATKRYTNLKKAIRNFMVPREWGIKLAFKLNCLLAERYGRTNPLDYAARNEMLHAIRKDGLDSLPNLCDHRPAPGITVMGPAGVGKTYMIDKIQSLYPPIIRHDEYEGKPVNCYQIPFLYVPIEADGTFRSLVNNLFNEIDRLIPGLDLTRANKGNYRSTNELKNAVAAMIQEFNIGAIIVDETEQLENVTRGKDKAKDYLVALMNKLQVPIVFIGTAKFANMLCSGLHFARRSTDEGLLKVEPFTDKMWDVFISYLWKRYQFTKTETKLSDELKDLFYTLTKGYAFEAVGLYCAVQSEAMFDFDNEKEVITPELVVRTAETLRMPTERIIKGVTTGNRAIMAENRDAYNPTGSDKADEGRGEISFWPDLEQEMFRRKEIAGRIYRMVLPDASDCRLNRDEVLKEADRKAQSYQIGTDEEAFINTCVIELREEFKAMAEAKGEDNAFAAA